MIINNVKRKKITQNTIIIMCWLIYSMAYLGRYSYNANITLIIDDFGISNAQAGLVATFFFFSYGIGQVVNGILCGRYNKKYVIPISLLVSSAINVVVLLDVPFFAIKYMWLLNGFIQSCLWPSIISVISKTVDNKNMDRATVFMGTTTCVGTIASYAICSLFAQLNIYRASFAFAALVMITLAIIWFFIYSPELEVYEKEERNTQEHRGTNGFFCTYFSVGLFCGCA